MLVQIQLQTQTTDELERRLHRVSKASLRYKDALRYLSSSQEEFSAALSDCRTVDQTPAGQTGRNAGHARSLDQKHLAALLTDNMQAMNSYKPWLLDFRLWLASVIWSALNMSTRSARSWTTSGSRYSWMLSHDHTTCQLLCLHPLQSTCSAWNYHLLQGHMPAAKSARKQMERTATDADKAQNKYLGNDFTGRFRRERTLEQTEAARGDAEHAQVDDGLCDSLRCLGLIMCSTLLLVTPQMLALCRGSQQSLV